ncbi:MAG: recombinase family protein [Cyanobacteria bacterium J007]|nr:MAG: recombinase family protein [Cyanobacteria bacterium J007]
MVFLDSVWIEGASRTGKTKRLLDRLCEQIDDREATDDGGRRDRQSGSPGLLVISATSSDRRDLRDRLGARMRARGAYPTYAIDTTTPLGFFRREVLLFWPLLVKTLHLSAHFPLHVRPETEQELATALWRRALDEGKLRQEHTSEYRLVRRILDLFQLAAARGLPYEDIPQLLQDGFGLDDDLPFLWESMGTCLHQWRQWCLERGLLTYGLMTELYWRHLLPDPVYRDRLTRRYRAVFADDTDEYPAITRDLFEILLDAGAVGTFTYNPQGGIRSGLGADPEALQRLGDRCQYEQLKRPSGLRETFGPIALQLLDNPAIYARPAGMEFQALPFAAIQTSSRAQLLRATGEEIAAAVRQGQVKPGEIAVIAPGLDAIARYTLMDHLSSHEIPVDSLNEQRPLVSSPTIRALLTLLALVYPGLGHFLDRDSVAEMLVILSRSPENDIEIVGAPRSWPGREELPIPPASAIDLVRAGLIVDHCYAPATERPRLLPVNVFPRWDRLGYRATQAYKGIVDWIEGQRKQVEEERIDSASILLDRAIAQFIWHGSKLPHREISALRELLETARHYWDVDRRLQDYDRREDPEYVTVGEFIKLLRQGTISAKPFPVDSPDPGDGAVTVATIFQYRSARLQHRWHFWLDIGSPLWLQGGAATLFAAPLFLRDRPRQPWSETEQLDTDEERLERILNDLLARVGDRLILCHSDLATNGQEQNGPLLSLLSGWVESDRATCKPYF